MLRTKRYGSEIRLRWRTEDQGWNLKVESPKGCALVGREDGNVAEGEQAAESYHELSPVDSDSPSRGNSSTIDRPLDVLQRSAPNS
jgi:hypothetical protein